MPTLRDLLAVETLGLELLHGDPTTPYRGLRRADAPHAGAWLAPGELRLAEAPWEPGASPDPLFARDPAAVVYARTPRRRALPPALLRRARERGVPLLALPPTVGLERLEAAALRLLAEEAAPAGAAAVQDFLLGALDSAKPEREVLERLHRLTGASFALLEPWGEVAARSGPRGRAALPPGAHALPEGAFRAAGGPALLRRVRAAGRPRFVLVALDAPPELAPLLEIAAGALRVRALERAAEARAARAERSTLLAAWLSGREDPAALAERLREAGLEPAVGAVVLAAELGPPGARTPPPARLREAAREAGDELFHGLGAGALSQARPDHLLWVVGGEAAGGRAEALREALEAASGLSARVGVAPPHVGAQGLGRAAGRARLALGAAPAAGGVARFGELDPLAWVLTRQPPDQLEALRDRLLGPLVEADPGGKLRRTLRAWLRAPGDLRGLAAELHIHPNTLRYRLQRIEALLGRPLAQPETVARLYLAERAERLLAGPEDPAAS